MHRLRLPLLVLLLPLLGTDAAEAQGPTRAEVRALLLVYEADGAAMRAWMRTADASAYPAFLAAPLVAGALALVEPDARPAAYRLALTEVTVLLGVSALKRVVPRARPYNAVPGVTSRARGLDRRLLPFDPTSFPSGHAATAFGLATALSLSHPHLYVVLPSAAWAGSVALSRVWLGVHYPSDVLVGAAMGVGAGAAVYLLRGLVTPTFLEGGEEAGLFYIRLRL